MAHGCTTLAKERAHPACSASAARARPARAARARWLRRPPPPGERPAGGCEEWRAARAQCWGSPPAGMRVAGRGGRVQCTRAHAPATLVTCSSSTRGTAGGGGADLGRAGVRRRRFWSTPLHAPLLPRTRPSRAVQQHGRNFRGAGARRRSAAGALGGMQAVQTAELGSRRSHVPRAASVRRRRVGRPGALRTRTEGPPAVSGRGLSYSGVRTAKSPPRRWKPKTQNPSEHIAVS